MLLNYTLKMIKMANLIFYCVYFITAKTFLSSHENVPSHRLKVPDKISLWVNVTMFSSQGNADPCRIGEYSSYFQIFPGKGAHDIIRQSFPVSQNPRHSWYQTFPAAPEVNLPLVSKCFVRHWLFTHSKALVTSSRSSSAEGTEAGEWPLRASWDFRLCSLLTSMLDQHCWGSLPKQSPAHRALGFW